MSTPKLGTLQWIRIRLEPDAFGSDDEAKTDTLAGLGDEGITTRLAFEAHLETVVRGVLQGARELGVKVAERQKGDDRFDRYRAALDELFEVTGKPTGEINAALELGDILILEPIDELRPYVVAADELDDWGPNYLLQELKAAHRAGLDGRLFELVEKVEA